MQNDKVLSIKDIMIGSKVVGILYVIFGVFSVVALFGSNSLFKMLSVHTDIVSGFSLILIGILYLYGHNRLHKEYEGLAYVFVALALSIIVSFTYLLIIIAHTIQRYVLNSEDYEDWTLFDSFGPGLYLMIFAMILIFPYVHKNRRIIKF